MVGRGRVLDPGWGRFHGFAVVGRVGARRGVAIMTAERHSCSARAGWARSRSTISVFSRSDRSRPWKGGEQGVGGRVVLAGFPSAGGGQDPAGAGVHGSAQPGGGPAGDGLQGDGAGELGLPVVLGQGAPSAGRLGRLEALVGVPVGLGGPLLLGAGAGGGLAIGEVLVGVAGGHAGVADVHGGAGPGAHEVRVAAAHAGVQAVGAHVVDVPGPGAVDDPADLPGGDGGVVGVGGCGAFVDELEGVGLEFLGQVAPVGHVGQGGDAPGAGGPDPVQDVGHVGFVGEVQSHPGRPGPAGSVPSAVGGAWLGQVGGSAHYRLLDDDSDRPDSVRTGQPAQARGGCGWPGRLRRRVVSGRWRRSPRPCRAGLGGWCQAVYGQGEQVGGVVGVGVVDGEDLGVPAGQKGFDEPLVVGGLAVADRVGSVGPGL